MITEDDRFPRIILPRAKCRSRAEKTLNIKATAVYPVDDHWFGLDESECMLITNARFTHPSHPLLNASCPLLSKLNSARVHE